MALHMALHMDSKHSLLPSCWSGKVEGYAVLAELTHDDKDGATLLVHIHKNGRAWKGSITGASDDIGLSAPTGCAATRGTALPVRVFKLLQSGNGDLARTRIQDDPPNIAVDAAWGVEHSVRGLYLPIASVALSSTSPREFHTTLFTRIARAHAHHSRTQRRIAVQEDSVTELRYADATLARLAPVLRHRKAAALTRALNNVKMRQGADLLPKSVEKCPKEQITQQCRSFEHATETDRTERATEVPSGTHTGLEQQGKRDADGDYEIE